MNLRDEAERAIRAWNAHEIARGSNPVVDFDCHPTSDDVQSAAGRLPAYRTISDLQRQAESAAAHEVAHRLQADRTYLAAMMGERLPLAEYVSATQGCPANGWPPDYIDERGEIARGCLEGLGLSWGPKLDSDFQELCGPIDRADAPDAIREAAANHEPAVRQVTGTSAPFELTIETTDVDDYWSYWLDGAGSQVRLRLNMRSTRFSHVDARVFALHEVLGHGLQNASYAARCAREDVPWVRMTSIHALHQVLLEGLAQTMPLFVAPGDQILTARVRLVHYTQLVRAELHVSINAGVSVEECAKDALARVPWWSESVVGDLLADRGTSPRLRSYLWAYPAGIDWFSALAEADTRTSERVLRAAYQEPLSPDALTRLWPAGPPIGGPGTISRSGAPVIGDR